jgi:hypothetical protein
VAFGAKDWAEKGCLRGNFSVAVEGEGWTFGRKIPRNGIHKIIAIENNKKAGATDLGISVKFFSKKILDKMKIIFDKNIEVNYYVKKYIR